MSAGDGCLAHTPETRPPRQQRTDLVNLILKWGAALAGTLLVTLAFRILDQINITEDHVAALQAAQAVCAARLETIDRPGGRLDRIQELLQEHILLKKYPYP